MAVRACKSEPVLVPRLCCEKALDQTPIETAVVAIKNNERIIFLLANFSKVLSAPCSRHGFIVKPDPDQSKIRLRHANATFPKYLIRDYRRSFAWPIAKKIALGAGPGPKPKCWHKKPKVMAPRIASGLLRPVRFLRVLNQKNHEVLPEMVGAILSGRTQYIRELS
jgi:hypothetical protein